MSYPILAFHGTDEGNIKSIVENNFKVPGIIYLYYIVYLLRETIDH